VNQGPNVRRLIVYRMSTIMVPKGGGIVDALQNMCKPNGIGDAAREATEWVKAALMAVKSAPGGSGMDDEYIAGEILSRIPDRRLQCTPTVGTSCD
jgi:hypothetical protein